MRSVDEHFRRINLMECHEIHSFVHLHGSRSLSCHVCFVCALLSPHVIHVCFTVDWHLDCTRVDPFWSIDIHCSFSFSSFFSLSFLFYFFIFSYFPLSIYFFFFCLFFLFSCFPILNSRALETTPNTRSTRKGCLRQWSAPAVRPQHGSVDEKLKIHDVRKTRIHEKPAGRDSRNSE